MGIIVISGVFGAVTALLYATRRMIGRLSETNIFIKNLNHIRTAENGTLIFIAGATGLSMAVFTNYLNRNRRLVQRSIDTKRDSSLKH